MSQYTPDACPGLMPLTADHIAFAKKLADTLVPSGRDRPRPEQQVVSRADYNALVGEFEHMKNTANEALETCEYIAADRDAACIVIGQLRRGYGIPLTQDDLAAMIDTERDRILAETP